MTEHDGGSSAQGPTQPTRPTGSRLTDAGRRARDLARVRRGELIRSCMRYAGQSVEDLSRRTGLSRTTLTEQLHGVEKLGPEVEESLWPTVRQALYRRLLEQADGDADEGRGDSVMSAALRLGAKLGDVHRTVDEAMGDGVLDDQEADQIARAANDLEAEAARLRRGMEGRRRPSED